MHRQVFAVFLLVALAGCAATDTATTTTSATTTTTTSPGARPDPGPPPPMEPWTPNSCDPSKATAISRDAELVVGLRGSADDIARRIGEGVGDPVNGDPVMYEDTAMWAWPTRKGNIFIQMSEVFHPATPPDKQGHFQGASYVGNGSFSASRAVAFAQGLGAEPTTLKLDAKLGRVWQEWAGLKLDHQPPGRGGIGWQNRTGELLLGVGPLFRFQAMGYNVTPEEATDTAGAYMRCTLDSGGRTAAKGWALRKTESLGISVHNRTIVHMVRVHFAVPYEAPCGAQDANWVYVDAWTRAVKGRDFAPCN